MARQNINIGSSANDGTGDPLRTAFDKINDNFVELYGSDDDSKTLANNLDVNGHNIISSRSNEDIKILPAGTGGVIASAVRIAGTTISSDDSSQITIAENIQTTGTLNVAGATTLATSLTLATGATVTGILDEDNMSTDSATQLATQQSIKAYVDSQVTAQDLDLAGDSGTGAVDLDSQSLTIAGGTGLDSVAGSQTVTLNIDATVATLTGSQTLTNKVLTSPTISSPTITGITTTTSLTTNDITSNGSDANITINPQGSGTIELAANTNVTGTASVSGTLTTADITTTGNTTVSGNSTVAGIMTVQGSINADTFVSSSNGDITLDPAGTGAIVLTGPITATGTQTTTGQLNVDNLRLDGNTLSATSGGITLSPTAGQNVTVSGTGVKLTAAEANFTLMEATTVRTDTLSTDTSNGDLTIGTQGTGNIVIDTETIARTGDLIIDASGDIYLDADGGDIFLKDGTAGTFAAFVRSGTNDLTISSSGTSSMIFTDADVAFQGDVTVAGAFIGSRQTISGAGAINLTTLFTELTTTGTDAYSLANGTVGQVKIITMAVDGGDATITPTTFANGTSITMDAVHDSVTLIYGANGWVVLASQNITINA